MPRRSRPTDVSGIEHGEKLELVRSQGQPNERLVELLRAMARTAARQYAAAPSDESPNVKT